MGKLLPSIKKRSGRISRVLCAVSRAAVIHLRLPSPAGVKATYPRFGPAFRRGRMSCPSLFGLAHDEVCLPRPLPDTWWALTPPFHPYHFWRYVFCGTLCPRRALTSLSVPTCPGCCPASRPIEPGLSSTRFGYSRRIAPRRRRPLPKKTFLVSETSLLGIFRKIVPREGRLPAGSLSNGELLLSFVLVPLLLVVLRIGLLLAVL
jgi:hypothetical protein